MILNLVWDFCDMAKNGVEAGGLSNKVQELFVVAVSDFKQFKVVMTDV